MPRSDNDWAGSDKQAFPLQWARTIADALNTQLADWGARFTALVGSEPRTGIASTVAAFGSEPVKYDPPVPTLFAPAKFLDSVRVYVVDQTAGSELAAAVLLATPENKADSDSALAFAVQAAALASRGIGVVIVDAAPGVPRWATHLHSLVSVYPITRRPRGGESPVLVIQPEVRDGVEQFAVWHHTVATGAALPTVPVPVRGAMHLKLDLDATYQEAIQRSRVQG